MALHNHSEESANARISWTKRSTTDPDSRLFKKARGAEAKLAYLGEVLMENRHRLVVDACVVPATGTGEGDAATSLIASLPPRQGIHVVRDDLPPEAWTAQDLEALMVLVYRRLPEHEPRWRDTGTITHARFIDPASGRVTLALSLQIGRGDYVAHLRLPAFPTLAFAEWLRYRHCDIRLRQPVMRLELIPRGWRHIERIDVACEARPGAERPADLYRSLDFETGKPCLNGYHGPKTTGVLSRDD